MRGMAYAVTRIVTGKPSNCRRARHLLRDGAVLDLQRRNVEVLTEQLKQTRDRSERGFPSVFDSLTMASPNADSFMLLLSYARCASRN
jgi:hypothetical protein